MSKPLIGITTSRLQEGTGIPRASLNLAYIQAVQLAGGIPLLVPVGIPTAQLGELLPRLDGILFSGGVDIAPARYAAPMHPEVTGVDEVRDELEIHIVRWVVEQKKPFLGICRGIEIINVALGGTLYTHIADQLPNALFHPCYVDLPRNLLTHTVAIKENSRLARIMGETSAWVNSLHHQGIHQLAPALQASAFASDGLMEGVELADHPFALGVQWHPEELVAFPPMLALFQALVHAAAAQ